jgi:hypothetical protein
VYVAPAERAVELSNRSRENSVDAGEPLELLIFSRRSVAVRATVESLLWVLLAIDHAMELGR